MGGNKENVLIDIANGLDRINSHLRELLSLSTENFGTEGCLEIILGGKEEEPTLATLNKISLSIRSPEMRRFSRM